MVKKLSLILVCLFASLMSSFVASAQSSSLDPEVLQTLDQKFDEYFIAMAAVGTNDKIAEVDYLIDTCEDPELKQHIALRCYAYFMESKVMGDEAIPIHLTEKYFASKKIEMLDDFDRLNAMVFAEFNRQSLIGRKAPSLTLETIDGQKMDTFSTGSKRLRIIYFYDTGCSKCKIETPLLCRAINNEDYPVDVYAVYTGSSKEAWEEYVGEKFDITAPEARIYHLWDPQRESDFERKYGVLQTPRMLLVSRNGTIIGRGLDTEALITLLQKEYAIKYYDFGSSESTELFDSVFSIDDGSGVMRIADDMASSFLAKGDTLSFKEISGDLLYWLTSQRGEGYKKATEEFITKYITEDNGIWTDSWDSLKVVGLGEMTLGLLQKSPIGSKVPDYKVKGTLINMKGEKRKAVKLSKLNAQSNYIIFHTEGCSVCEKELSKAKEVLRHEMNIFEVNIDQIMESNRKLAGQLLDTFDLSGLPFMIETDQNGIIRRKYVSFLEQ